MENNYRTRIYGTYVSTRRPSLAPASLEGLKPRLPYLRNLIRGHFPHDRNAKILDLGCCHGALIHLARQAGYRNLRGVDGSLEQVAAAKVLRIEGIEHGDVLEVLVNEPDETLDCLIAFDLIEHFNRNELIPLIDSALRVLRPGGRWIIHAPKSKSPFGMRILYGDYTYGLAFTRISLSQLLLSSGFSRVNCYEDQPVPHGVISTVRWALWQIIRNLLHFYLAIETGHTDRYAVFSQNIVAVAWK